MKEDIVIIGAGPAGLYCAEELLQTGRHITIIDRGPSMEDRACPKTKYCDCRVCNILCGVGGAGGFSDGKNTISLTRGTQLENLFPPQAEAIMHEVDESVARYADTCGVIVDPVDSNRFSKEGFKFSSYPLRHVGSDGIRRWATNMKQSLRSRGVDFILNTDVTKILNGFGDGSVHGVQTADGSVVNGTVIAATGLDGSPWIYRELVRLGATFQPGPAGFAIRLETASRVLDPLFQEFYDWKMERGRLRSFCCNHHGYVLNENHISLGIRNVNGHSFLDPARRSESSNCAIMSKITTDMVPNPQEMVKTIATCVNTMVGGHTVIQKVEDFINEVPSDPHCMQKDDPVRTNYQAIAGVDIGLCLKWIDGLREDYQDYLLRLDAVCPGVASDKSFVYAPEVKYYSARVNITPDWQVVGVPNLYCIGNASGYLDSFVAAATSGVMAAKSIVERN